MKGLLLILGALGIGAYAYAKSDDTSGESDDKPVPPPNKPGYKLPCLAEYEKLAAFAKAKGYKLYYVENQAVSTWKPPKADYLKDPMARAFSVSDCSFYEWATYDGAPGQWIQDTATGAEFAAFLATGGEKVVFEFPNYGPVDVPGFPPIPGLGNIPTSLGDVFKTSGKCKGCGE